MIRKAQMFGRNIIKSLNTYSYRSTFMFSNQVTTTTYPYLFGGLKNVPFQQNQTALLTLKQLFDPQTLQGFKQAYRFTLQSLAQKDLNALKNICQPNLTKNLNLKNVQLINSQANIDAVCGKSFKAFGATFIRENSMELKEMKADEGTTFYLNFGLMNPNNPATAMKVMSGGISILMAFQVFFKSTMKLVPAGAAKNQRTQQIHSIQFEVEGKMNMMKYMKIAMAMNSNQAKLDFNEAKHILKDMVGDNFQWKIGDIDRALKGNIKILP